MALFHDDVWWLTEPIPEGVSEFLCRALALQGQRPQTDIVLDRLAPALGIKLDRLREDGYLILDRVRVVIQEGLEDGPLSFGDAEDNRCRKMAEKALKDSPSWMPAFAQFGWTRTSVEIHANPRAGEAIEALRQSFIRHLAGAIWEAMRDWERANVWRTQGRGTRRRGGDT